MLQQSGHEIYELLMGATSEQSKDMKPDYFFDR